MDLVAELIKSLALVVQDRLDPCYKQLAHMNWTNVTQVTEESVYIQQMGIITTECLNKISPIISEVYIRNLCSKIAHDILLKYCIHLHCMSIYETIGTST